MAIRGISREKVFYYVPEDDRNAPLNEQTVFHMKAKKFGDGNVTARRYMGSEKTTTRKGFRDIDDRKLTQADLGEFLDTVVQVDNWIFSQDFGGDGETITPVLSTPNDIEKVCKDMANELLNEILEASNDISKLEAGQKKSSNSSATSIIGKQKTQTGKQHLSATTVGE